MKDTQPRADVQAALEIPKLGHAEAGQQAAAELARTLALLERLADEDWQQPTACTLWNVRDMVAHLAGACAGHAIWSEFKRQYLQNPYMRQAKVKVDAVNRQQIEDRAGATPPELIAELRAVGPKAIRTRQRLPWWLRVIPVPFGPPLGAVPIEYLTDLIYIRDMWMHRLDICRATGRDMALTPEHDGRIVALVIRDVCHKLRGQLEGKNIILELTGPAGGAYCFGQTITPDAIIQMDALEFNWLASGRMGVEQAASKTSIQGDMALATWFLARVEVPY